MEEDITARLATLEAKLDALWAAVEKIRKYLLVTAVVSVAMFVLPLLALIVVVPMFVRTLQQLYTVPL